MNQQLPRDKLQAKLKAAIDIGRATMKSADWPFEVRPLHPRFGVEIANADIEELSHGDGFKHLYDAFLRHQLILFRGVDLPPATQVALARRFGEVQVHVMNQYHAYSDHPEIYVLSNEDEHGRPNAKHPDKGTLHWHTDGSWRATPGLATMMYAEKVPSQGGQTEFADMYGGFEQLSETWRNRIANLNAIHNLDFSRTRRHGEDPMSDQQKAQVPPVPHPVARAHPETGRTAVFLGDHAETIEGMDYAAGRALIEELSAIIAPDDLVYSHNWAPGECMVWDNRCLLHRATPFDTANEIRVMRRCTTLGQTPTERRAAH